MPFKLWIGLSWLILCLLPNKRMLPHGPAECECTHLQTISCLKREIIRRLGTGSLIGFFISGSDLTIPFGWISSSQIKLISLLAIITFIFTHSLTCYSVTERILLANQAGHSSSLTSTLKSIWSTFRTLPLPIWRVMQVQILSWLAMFAVMFYSSTWVRPFSLRWSC